MRLTYFWWYNKSSRRCTAAEADLDDGSSGGGGNGGQQLWTVAADGGCGLGWDRGQTVSSHRALTVSGFYCGGRQQQCRQWWWRWWWRQHTATVGGDCGQRLQTTTMAPDKEQSTAGKNGRWRNMTNMRTFSFSEYVCQTRKIGWMKN